jgi:putative oxidoreductase
MTTLTLNTTEIHAEPARSKAATITLWTVQSLVAALFLFAGIGKLAGMEMHVKLFEAIGIGQWFRYVTGAIEAGSAVLLFVPALAVFAALALVATMTGAVLTHLFVIGGNPTMPIVLLAASASIAWVRRNGR